MMRLTISFLVLFFCLFLNQKMGFAQEELPALKIETMNGTNIISWSSPYDGVKSVLVQRSADSTLNFATIGFLNKPKKGIQSYEDKTPLLGKNYYRVNLIFASDIEWYSNTYKVDLDSATIALSRNIKLSTGRTNANESSAKVDKEFTDFYYEPSTQVYTNPYTGHINISLADAQEKMYSITFYDPKKEEVLKIARIKNTMVVLDKYNFNAQGTYMFQLKDGKVLVESGYVTIY